MGPASPNHSKPLHPIRMQGQQKILPSAGEEGYSSNENACQQYHMQQKQSECSVVLDTTNSTCKRSNQNASFPDTYTHSTNQHPAAVDTTTPCVMEARHNAEKHFLL